MSGYGWWADLVVVFHAAYAGVVVFGMVAILVGVALGWQWVRNFWFRLAHFLMIAAVVAESLLGVACPLTVLEDQLRARAGEAVYPGSFIGRWVHELLFYDVPPWAFTVAYTLFGSAVLATMILAPPRWPWVEHPTR